MWSTLLGQTNTILFENFTSSTFPPDGWMLIDHDGDGKDWYQRTDNQTGNRVACSKSWESSPLTPHNLLITSSINLSGFTNQNRLRVSYKVAATGNSYYNEHYKVVISTSGNNFEDFNGGTVLLEETLTQAQSGWNFTTRIVDLDEYAGVTFHIAWVHYSCTDEDAIVVDDIHVYEGEDPESEPPYVSWLTGSTENAETQNNKPGIVLAGGGGDNSDAMKWFLQRADGGDVVVIRSSGSDGYNNYLYTTLGIPVNSVETLLINSREAAEHPYVEQQIRNAEALFIAGGDQYDYFLYWKDTRVMDAINYLINEKGAVVGGTSAGMAILGKVYYAPSGSSAQSATVLQNPFHSSVNIIGRNDFISTLILENTITDTHFDQRDRAGRLFTFLSRMVTDWGIDAKGIAANEYSAVCIDENGKAYVFGNPSYDDYAYFLQAGDCAPETCVSNQPLTWNCDHKAVKVYRVLGKKTDPGYLDLNDWSSGEGGTWHNWYSQNGTLYKSDATSVLLPQQKRVNVFPNPTDGKVTVMLENQSTKISIDVYCTMGSKVFTYAPTAYSNQVDIELSHLPSGFYIIRITDGDKIHTSRIVKSLRQ